MEENLYWEDFWELIQMAANFAADERNAELKFQFMLHADKKSARKWRDLPVPFPMDEKEIAETIKDKSGVSQIPSRLRRVVYRE